MDEKRLRAKRRYPTSGLPGDTLNRPGSLYDSTAWYVLKTSSFTGAGMPKTFSMTYTRQNAESRWFDYEVFNYGNYKVSVDYPPAADVALLNI